MRGDGGRLRRAALGFAARGWPVLPLHAPTAGGCTCSAGRDCGSVGKHPRTPAGLKDASADLEVVAGWWDRWPTANLGMVTGSVSSTMVLDVDLPAGPDALARLEAEHGRLPRTLMQRTGSGGRQLVFTYPAGGVGSRVGLVAGLDVRGDGGYVVVPPSLHRSGRRYRWIRRGEPAAPPGWLVELVRPPRVAVTAPVRCSTGAPGQIPAYAQAALDGELEALAAATEHGRNGALNRAAFSLGQLVGAGLLEEGQVRAELERVARQVAAKPCRQPFTDREIAKTITSGLGAGMRRPRLVDDRRRGAGSDRARGGGGR